MTWDTNNNESFRNGITGRVTYVGCFMKPWPTNGKLRLPVMINRACHDDPLQLTLRVPVEVRRSGGGSAGSRGRPRNRCGTSFPSCRRDKASASMLMMLRQCWPVNASAPRSSYRRSANSAANRFTTGCGDASLMATRRADSLSSCTRRPSRHRRNR